MCKSDFLIAHSGKNDCKKTLQDQDKSLTAYKKLWDLVSQVSDSMQKTLRYLVSQVSVSLQKTLRYLVSQISDSLQKTMRPSFPNDSDYET